MTGINTNSGGNWERAQVPVGVNSQSAFFDVDSSRAAFFETFQEMGINSSEIPSIRRMDARYASACAVAVILNVARSAEISASEGVSVASSSVYPYLAAGATVVSLVFLKIRQELGNYRDYLKDKNSNQNPSLDT